MPAGRSGRRQVPPQDVARYWQARASGMSIKESAKIAAVHYNTAQKWDTKRRVAQADLELARIDQGKTRKKEGGVQADQWKQVMDVADLPPVIPFDRLCPEAQRSLDDLTILGDAIWVVFRRRGRLMPHTRLLPGWSHLRKSLFV
jgi:hypothetical protein